MSLIKRYLDSIHAARELGQEVVHLEKIPPRRPMYAAPPAGLVPELAAGLTAVGAKRLYSHQAEAIELALAGRDVVVVTPTASGKTLCYNVPVINRCAQTDEAHALYLFPIKALEQDQLGGFRELAAAAGLGDRVTAEIYDGDTPSHKRSRIRGQPPSAIITNPDMIHLSFLPYHDKWERFLSRLEFIVLDEVHVYRGVFGSHVANVLRRLFRVAARYGARPQVIACSGTIANPGELAGELISRPAAVVDQSGAPEAGKSFLFINPKRLSASTVASRLLREAVRQDLATIVFTKARKITELIYAWTIQAEPRLGKSISAYRAGYLPEERREIERKLFSGEMKGVISTSALEMGVDIGALDVCILVGYPGAISTTWQRGGRVGRKDRDSLVVLIAGQDALDQYFMKRPEAFFKSGFEPAVIDPRNKPIMKSHLVCAAAEAPLGRDDPWFYGEEVAAAVAELVKEGRLLRAVEEDSWRSVSRRPQREINIRGVGESHTIFEEPKGKPEGQTPRAIGSLEGARVHSEGHPGAIYLHRARSYQITRLDLERKNLYARPVTVDYYTMPRKEKETSILATRKSKLVKNFVARLGELKVTERVVGYDKKRVVSGERLSTHPLELPPSIFETVGFWIEIDDFIPRAVERRGLHFMGGIHAVEHAAISLFPLFALCERDDVGGISIPMHPEVGKAAIFVYDGYPGGVGLAERSFARIEALLESTLALIAECECEVGCPGCIYSNKCGSGNVPLDKAAAAMILAMLLDKEEAREWRKLGERPGLLEEEFGAEEDEVLEEAVEARGPRVMVLDVETRRGAEEVGGWGSSHLMGVAVAVTWDSHGGELRSFREDQVEELLRHLAEADLVVGFNLIRFDFKVLSAYDHGTLPTLPVFDLLADLHHRLGFRLSLGHLAEHTLGEAKSADGLQSLEWVKQGRLDLVEEYCKKDVVITRDLFYHGLEQKSLRFLARDGKLLELGLDWRLEDLIEKAKKKAAKKDKT